MSACVQTYTHTHTHTHTHARHMSHFKDRSSYALITVLSWSFL